MCCKTLLKTVTGLLRIGKKNMKLIIGFSFTQIYADVTIEDVLECNQDTLRNILLKKQKLVKEI